MILRLLFFFAVFLSSTDTRACSCGYQEIGEALETSDFSFRGKVISVKPYGPTLFNRVRFDTSATYKVKSEKIDSIYTHQFSETCGYTFRENEEYIVFGFFSEIGDSYILKGEPWVSLCSRTLSLKSYNLYDLKIIKEVTEYLENLETGSYKFKNVGAHCVRTDGGKTRRPF